MKKLFLALSIVCAFVLLLLVFASLTGCQKNNNPVNSQSVVNPPAPVNNPEFKLVVYNKIDSIYEGSFLEEDSLVLVIYSDVSGYCPEHIYKLKNGQEYILRGDTARQIQGKLVDIGIQVIIRNANHGLGYPAWSDPRSIRLDSLKVAPAKNEFHLITHYSLPGG